jgi:hypothetical protein
MIDAAYPPPLHSNLVEDAYEVTRAVRFDERELAGLEAEAHAAGLGELRVALFGLRVLVSKFPHCPDRIRQAPLMRDLRVLVAKLRGEAQL